MLGFMLGGRGLVDIVFDFGKYLDFAGIGCFSSWLYYGELSVVMGYGWGRGI